LSERPLPGKKIRVLLIDDSPVALAVIQKVLASDRDIEVVASFLDPQKALAQIAEINPDVICVDFFMKRMDGLEFTKIVTVF
jgi:two-component system chemotaxis response regulator CheB